MELDCIPAGMEIFPAIDDEQFNFITRIIDDCDYYLLIIGGRYGSISENGLSYTEKEYNYAIEKDIKVVAFIHANPDAIPLGKSEKEEALRIKLENFKAKVSTNRLVKFWNNAEELPGLGALSLSKTIKTYPAIGWVRANVVTNIELLQELNEQRKENQELKAKVQQFEKGMESRIKLEDLAGLDEPFDVHGSCSARTNYGSTSWKLKTTWREIFFLISPYLLEHPNDAKAEDIVSQALFKKSEHSGYSPHLAAQIYQTIKIQLKLLGLSEWPKDFSQGPFDKCFQPEVF